MLGVIALLAVGLMGTGGGRKVKRVRRRSEMPKSEVEQSKEDDLPAPVKSEEDASTRRDQKLSRSQTNSISTAKWSIRNIPLRMS